MIILNSINNNENVSIMNQNTNKSINAQVQNNNFEPKSQVKLSARSSSRASSASTTPSNTLFPNLTPQATHIATRSQFNHFNRPVSSGQIVNILTRKASDLEKDINKMDKKNRLTPPLSLSDPNFSAKSSSNEKTFVSTQVLNLKSLNETGQVFKERPKSSTENSTLSKLTVNNLNHFDNLNETPKNYGDTLSPIPSFSSKSSSPNDSSSPIMTVKVNNSEYKDNERNKSPQTLKSISTLSHNYDGTKSAGLLSNSSAGRAKKKVSFNDNLLKVHLIPNLTNFLTVEKCKPVDKDELMVSIEEQAYGSYCDEEPDSPLIQNNFNFIEGFDPHNLDDSSSTNKAKLAKTHLKQIQSDQTISNDLKRNIRNHNLNNHLQVVKLTVHPNKSQLDNRTQNFLSLVGNNNFSQKLSKRDSSTANRNLHSKLFTQQRSQTFHFDELDRIESIDELKTNSSSINLSKNPKYTHPGSRSTKPPKNDHSKHSDEAKSKIKRVDSSKENDLNLNLIKKPTKFVFLKQDDNMAREPSFIKSQLEKNFFNNNSSSSFASDSNLKVAVDPKNSSINKTATMNSVNQLIALKDVNYYLNNSTKSNLKSLKSSYPYQNGLNDINKIKLKSNGHLANISNLDLDFRRTNSAFPLLRNNMSNGSVNQTNPNESSKISNNLSFKIMNSSSPLGNSLTRAKTFLQNQNLASKNHIDKKIKESSIEKTSF